MKKRLFSWLKGILSQLLRKSTCGVFFEKIT
jgi:hypothetical protein